MKVLMICLGNICRSPMAEGILRHKAEERGFTIKLDSCGTNGYHDGEGADPRAVKNLSQKGIGISDLRSRKFRVSDFDEFDRLFVMDQSNYDNIIALARNEADRNKVSLFLNEAFPGKNRIVPDPYFGGDEGFETVYHLLTAASDAFLNSLKNV